MKAATVILLLLTAVSGQTSLRPSPTIPVEQPVVERGMSSFRVGSFKAFIRESGLDIQFGNERYHLDRSKFPVYAIDCRDSSQCPKPKPAYCENCVKLAELLMWDEPHRKLFFAIATDTSKNKPWILVGYDPQMERVTRYGEFWGAGAGLLTASPSGRHLAFVTYGVSGICATSALLQVVDLTERRFGSPPAIQPDPGSQRQIIRIQTLRWLNNSEIAYEADTYPEEECRDSGGPTPRKADATLRLSDFKF